MNSKYMKYFAFLIIVPAILASCVPKRISQNPTTTISPEQIIVLSETLASSTVEGSTPTPEINTPLPVETALIVPPEDEASARLSVPDGFVIRIFAQGLQGKVRFMAFGPDNALYATLTNRGAVLRLTDHNLDGLTDASETVLEGLNQPHGLEWLGDWLYVAENDRVERFHFSSLENRFDHRELVTDNLPRGGGHYTRTIHFGPDGKMYVSAGSSCNVCVESDPRRAAILRFNQDGTIPADNPYATDPDVRKQAVWATGLRNSVDFLWTPSGELWANTNGRDNLIDGNGLPDNLPPEVIVFSIRPGGFFGWPYCYSPTFGFSDGTTPQVLDPQSGLTMPNGLTCEQAIPATFTDLAHVAPLGMTLGAEGNFPPAYQQGLYVAYHGSWNVQSPDDIRDCKIVRVIVENGLPVRSEDFVNGWRAPGKNCGDGSAYGRPADVIFGPNGAMYISDDAAGRIYRVVAVQ